MSHIEQHDISVNDKVRDNHAELPVWGAAAIAPIINRSKRQTAHLLAIGAIKCVRKIGGRYCAYPSALRREFGG
jgi:hypothetical protein